MINKNILAALAMLRFSEGTSTSKYTKNNGYDVIVNGIGGEPKTFSDYSTHPNVLVTVNNNGLKSTAAGGYQILFRNWVAYKSLLGLKDFGPASQDAIAIQIIRERGAYNDFVAGRLEVAVKKISNIWASLPDNKYGQKGGKTIVQLRDSFIKNGGILAE